MEVLSEHMNSPHLKYGADYNILWRSAWSTNKGLTPCNPLLGKSSAFMDLICDYISKSFLVISERSLRFGLDLALSGSFSELVDNENLIANFKRNKFEAGLYCYRLIGLIDDNIEWFLRDGARIKELDNLKKSRVSIEAILKRLK